METVMSKTVAADNVISADKLPELRELLEELEAQRKCMRIPDNNWRAMKARAKKSHKSFIVALQGELSACAYKIMQYM